MEKCEGYFRAKETRIGVGAGIRILMTVPFFLNSTKSSLLFHTHTLAATNSVLPTEKAATSSQREPVLSFLFSAS